MTFSEKFGNISISLREQYKAMIENTLERIADALERLAATNEALLSGAAAPAAVAETPAPAATGKGKAKAKETPAPEPEAPKADVGAECKELRAVNTIAYNKDKAAAKKIFTDYQAKVGIEKIEDMSSEQRTELKGLLQAFIEEEAPM